MTSNSVVMSALWAAASIRGQLDRCAGKGLGLLQTAVDQNRNWHTTVRTPNINMTPVVPDVSQRRKARKQIRAEYAVLGYQAFIPQEQSLIDQTR
jgi:hypothetical protein